MRLRKVEINGFNSFGKKTVIEFPEGISAIVGPNGSGKSNVIDSICFGLGYPSRNLRAANAQELIHSGSAGNLPHAKVGLTFNNGKEVLEVDRKVDRKGKSTYHLNSVTTTLDDVHDTLSKHAIPKNGYNIVMQNDVMKFIEIKPKERRQVLDQISGISGYEEKKKKSLEELSVVERRISDTNLILSEKKGYLEEIGKDREIAMKYQAMQDELKKSKSVYFYSTLYDLNGEADLMAGKLSGFAKDKDIKIIELARIDEQAEEMQKKLEEITKKILHGPGGESGKMKGEMGALNSAIEKKQEEIQFLKGEIEGLEGKKKENAGKQREIAGEIKGKEADIKKLRVEIEKVTKALAAKEKEREAKTAEYDNSELIALEKERKGLSEAVFEAKKSLTIIDKDLEAAAKRQEELAESLSQKKATLKILESEVKEREKDLTKLGAEAEKVGKLSAQLEETKNKLSEMFQEFARTESEIKTIERMEAKIGESESLKFVTANKAKGYIGLVSELGKAPDKYRTALEAAVGDKGKCIVVKDDKAAQFYIEGLRKGKIGRATFLPLDKIKGPETGPIGGDGAGVVGYAKDLIKCEERYQKVFDFVFGDTVVVRDIDAARGVGIGSIKMVTLEGDVLAKGGAMTGGYYQKAAITFSSTEDKKKALEKLKSDIAALKDDKDSLEKELEGKDRINIGVLQEKRANVAEKIEMLRKQAIGADEELAGLAKQQRELKATKADLEKDLAKDDKELKGIDEKMNMDAFKEMKSILQTYEGEVHDLKDHRFELQTRENALKGDIEAAKSRITDIGRQCDEIDSSVSKFKNKIQESIDNITESGRKLKEIEEKHSIITVESQKLFKEQERLSQLLKEVGHKRGSLEAAIERIKNQSNDLEIKKAKNEARLEEVKTGIEGLEAPAKDELNGADLAELKKRIKALETELGAVEGVNLRAVGMFDELQKQYGEIKERNDKLHVEKEKIYDLIETIEEQKKTIFYESFNRVKEQFSQIIGDLYPSTEGRLLLENENDPFNSGLILQVKPRGREGMNIDSLSGGEKTLTALAFLMATQSVTPSPFYILDECDAALDQENVLRLVQFLKNRKQSQFILISHNPETVKHMDSVVGVHMQKGLSQIVGVDMQMMDA